MKCKKDENRECQSREIGACKGVIGLLLASVGGLCALGMMVQSRISPELAKGFLFHSSIGFMGLLVCWLFGSFALKWLCRFRWQKVAWVAGVSVLIAAGWVMATRWQWLISPFVCDENFYTAQICKWVMANSVWIGKGVSQLDQITMKIHFPSSDMVLFTGVLEFGKIYLMVVVVLCAILFACSGALVSRITNRKMRILCGFFAFVLMLQVLCNFGVQFGWLPIFATHLPFISFGNEWRTFVDFLLFRDVFQTYFGFILLGLILSATTGEGGGKVCGKAKWCLPLVALMTLPMLGVFIAMCGTECRLPSSFMLHRIAERKSPEDIAVYDVYFSSKAAQSSHVCRELEKIAAQLNRTLSDGVETNKAFLATIATQSLLPGMCEAELKFLVRELYRKGILNYFVFHKSYVEKSTLFTRFEKVSEEYVASRKPDDFYGCVVKISDGTVVKEFLYGEKLERIGAVIQPFIALAAVENGVLSWDSLIDCRIKLIAVGNQFIQDFRCDKHNSTREMTVHEILMEKTNIGTVLIAEKVGEEKLNAFLSGYGFPTLAGDFPLSVFGQMMRTSPQQLISAYRKLIQHPEMKDRLSDYYSLAWDNRDEPWKKSNFIFSNVVVGIKDDYLVLLIARRPQGFSSRHYIREILNDPAERCRFPN